MIFKRLAVIFALAVAALGVSAQVTPNCNLTGVFYNGCAIQATTISGTAITGTSFNGLTITTSTGTLTVTDAKTLSYTDGTFTATATGGDTAPTGTVAYTVVGKNVTLYVPAFSFTSNASTYTLTGAPSAIIPPSSTTEWICPTIDNGSAAVMATCRIAAGTGVIALFRDIATNSFTTSGTKGNAAFSISYVLR